MPNLWAEVARMNRPEPDLVAHEHERPRFFDGECTLYRHKVRTIER
jgi:hypothetical protein